MENRGEREARRGLGSMGRVARWLRGLFGGGKKAAAASSGAPPEAREKKRWGSFVKSLREKEKRSEAVRVAAAAASYREVDGRDEDEQNKRAIAVAAATAAVAEAAVAAAQAAAAVVRLTSSGRVGGGKREESAAVKIQAAFRAYLARRALRALKGLVKLQALVRGNIVRKQAAETLRCMQALVRVQARARACRALRSDRNQLKSSSRTHPGAATPEKSEQSVRSNACKAERSSTLRRNSSKQTCANDARFDQDRAQTSALELRWLDQWMEERYCDNTTKSGMVDDEKNAKILEIDTGKPHYGSGSKRKSSNYVHSSCSPLTSDQLSHSFTTMPDSPSKDSTIAQQSIPRSSSVDMQSLSPLRFPIADGCDYIESPQFFSASSSRPPSSRRGPFTPAKSECSRSLFSGYSDYPNFMANTESSRAKVRSQSAPKQRPEFGKSGSMWRTSAGHGFGQQQSGSAAAQRSSSSSLHAKFTNKAYPGSGRLDR